MRIIRGIGATVLLLAAAFSGTFAVLFAGGSDSWNAFKVEYLFRASAIVFTIGCPMTTLTAVLVGRTGDRFVMVGALMAILSVALGIVGHVRFNSHPIYEGIGRALADGAPWLTVSLGLAIGAAIALSRRR